MLKKIQSDFLFAQPSFYSGAAGVITLWADLDDYNTSEDADSVALAADWQMVGQDIFTAMQQGIQTEE